MMRVARNRAQLVFEPSNIYGDARLGRNVKIGAYCDIGAAIIGDDVSIGAFAFIPGKTRICEGAWIGPRVTFTHTFPPAKPDEWKETVIGARQDRRERYDTLRPAHRRRGCGWRRFRGNERHSGRRDVGRCTGKANEGVA